jgi:hypothetical protein
MEADVRELFARSLRDATAKHTGAALDAALEELGWRDALATDEDDAVPILFELQGAHRATSSALDAVVLDALGLEADAVVFPSLGQWKPPATAHGDQFVVGGLVLGEPDRLLVVARDGDEDVAVAVSVTGLDVRPVHGLDPTLGLLQVRGQVDASGAQRVDWSTAVTHGQRAIGHELVGASRRMLDLACTHALERIQFGRPIAQFQAVRHRLAETLVAIETADAALDAAWQDRSAGSAAMAKALAGRGARTAARHCQQVLAGIGFTTEHPLQGVIKRALLLDQLFGSADLLTRDLGEQLVTTRALPPLLAL